MVGKVRWKKTTPQLESGILLLEIQDDLQLILSVLKQRNNTDLWEFHARYQDGEAKTLLKSMIIQRQNWLLCSSFLFHNSLITWSLVFLLY